LSRALSQGKTLPPLCRAEASGDDAANLHRSRRPRRCQIFR
jgi:hypothetical protein